MSRESSTPTRALGSTRDERREESPIPPDPSALLPHYADIALGYHRTLPAIQEEQRALRTITESHHVILSNITMRLEDIAVAVKARPQPARTRSGQMAAVSQPQPPMPIVEPEPLVIKTSRSPTGHHKQIEDAEVDRIQEKWRESELKAQWAKEMADAARVEAAEAREREKTTLDRWKFIMGALAFLGAVGAWILGNYTAAHEKPSPPPQVAPAR